MKLMEGIAIDEAKVGIDSSGSEFKHIITEAFNEKATMSIKTLGRYISGMKDFILRGYMLMREDDKHLAKWKVIKLEINK